MTGESRAYDKAGEKAASHAGGKHGARQYVRGPVSQSTVETSFAIFNRVLYGTFHLASEQHLQRYPMQFDSRSETRSKLGYNDEGRAEVALYSVGRKRLAHWRIRAQRKVTDCVGPRVRVFHMPTLKDYPPKPKSAPRFLPPAYLVALGNMNAYWAYLESATEICIWAMLNLGYQEGTAITAHMGQVTRLQVLTILTDLQFLEYPEAHSHLMEIWKTIDEVRIKRNDLTHAMWKHEKNKMAKEIYALKRSAKGKLKMETTPMTLKLIRDISIEIHWLTAGLQAFVEHAFPHAYTPWERAPS